MSVPIVVAEGHTGAPERICHTGLFRDIRERSIAVIVIQNVGAQVSDVNIHETVIVVVGESAPHSVRSIAHSSACCDIGEGPVPVIAE